MSGSTSILESKETFDTNVSGSSSGSSNEAIKLFEQAIEKESHGLMSEAVELYRKAFKLNDQVDLLYRSHKVPHTVKKLQSTGGKNSAVKVDEEIVKQINVNELLDSFEQLDIAYEKEDENGEANEASPLLNLPNDIWISILEILLISHPESWFNYSITCKKNAFLGFRSSILWMKLCNLVFPQQIYEENQLFTEGSLNDIEDDDLPIPKSQELIVPQYSHSWKKMLNERPFIKFSGCYISVVNYYSEGGRAEFSNSWTNPARSITYYRYLRFYPDGSCIKVLTHLDPSSVIPSLSRRNRFLIPVHSEQQQQQQQQTLQAPHAQSNQSQAQAAQSHAKSSTHQIFKGKWNITSDEELHVTITEGSVPTYDFHYFFKLKSSGPIFRHNKLAWIKYFALKKEIDEATGEREISEFTLKNERPFLFSKVRRYHDEIVRAAI
ncbi:F-box protein Hrt3p [[Candida] railenensis]|uniref:F-box protein Hrt3p n=1 Tax=[Candida] railenensis TaxID=45579 RepID=A0A9P0QNX1_9ASCO|nr:F-box protein Hrt3p [[Candida] railenensis]